MITGEHPVVARERRRAVSERALFVEFHCRGAGGGLVPHDVLVEETGDVPGTYTTTHHDVEDCSEADAEHFDLWHHDWGGGGHEVELSRFFRRWRWRNLRRPIAEVWWDESVTVWTLRPFVSWFHALPRRLGLWRLGRWLDREPKRWTSLHWWLQRERQEWRLLRERFPEKLVRWLNYTRATRLSLWRLGYRRRGQLPDWMPADDPFREMCEGDTIYCNICEQTYATDCDGGSVYDAFPGFVYLGDRGGRQTEWADRWEPAVLAYSPARSAAAWVAARALRDAASSWGNEGYKALGDSTGHDWNPEVKRAFGDRLEDLAEAWADLDAAPEPAGKYRIKRQALAEAEKKFPAAVKSAIERLERDIEEDTHQGFGPGFGLDTVDHVCPHVFFLARWGWTGPGYE